MTTDPKRVERVAAEAEAVQTASEAFEAALATAARVSANPIEVASENAALRSSLKGAYAIIRALVIRAGGSASIPTAELVQPGTVVIEDLKGRVTIKVDPAE